jgi:hypothetical protein
MVAPGDESTGVSRSMEEVNMIRVGMVGLAGVLASTVMANAQSPTERGRYLVDTVMTCHNCHTPMGRTDRSSTRHCRAGCASMSRRST